MNEQLPPVERSLADQLARRSAGRPPVGLLDEVLSAVDATPSAPVVRLAAFRSRARVSGALVGLAAVVALLAALVAVPALRNAPPAATTLPTDRALTTAELAALMAGPALPTNTAFVAEVTLRPQADVCPMNRYPTLGVIEGMRSQVCVVASTIPIAIAEGGPRTAIFAFRYLGPGVLGLLGLGQVTTPPSSLAFKVADDWPPQGAFTFVVDGWLGNSRPVGVADSCAEVAPAGDVLSPNGSAACPRSQDWLADSATPSAIDSPAASALADRSMDPSALFGNARLVDAYGARQIDGIEEIHPEPAPVHGRYVVRSATGACPAASAVSSVGCTHWLVLAKLADVAVPTRSAEPSPTTPASVPSGYPTEQALTSSQLAKLLDEGSLKVSDTVVADVTLADGGNCPAIDSATPMNLLGRIAGIEPAACVYTDTKPFVAGHVVLRMTGSRVFLYLGTAAAPAAGSRLTFDSGHWPDGGTFLVAGWLHSSNVVGNDPASCPDATPGSDGSIGCVVYSISESASGSASSGTPLAASGGATFGRGSGVYLVSADGSRCPNPSAPTADCQVWRLVAGLTDLRPASAPTVQPPTTPVPEPSQSVTPSPVVETAYPATRALLTPELEAVLQTAGIKQKVLVANTAIETGTQCPSLDGYQPIGKIGGADICVVGIGDGKVEHKPAKQSGIFAFRVLDAHTLGFMGDVTEEPTGKFSYSSSQRWPDGKTILVTGWAAKPTGLTPSCPAIPPPSHDPLDPGAIPCVGIWIVGQEPGQAFATTPPNSLQPRQVWTPAYPTEGFTVPTGRATYLLRSNVECNSNVGASCGWRILGVVDRLSMPAAPPPTPSPSAGAVGAPSVLSGPNGTPLTLAALYSAWKSDRNHLAGRTVITKGPLPASTACLTPDGLTPCDYAIAGEGYWVAQFGSDGSIKLVGKLSTPKSGFMWTVEELNVFDVNSGAYVVVDGDLLYDANCVPEAAQCSTSQIAGKVNVIASVNKGAYEAMSGGSTGSEAIPGPFLVHLVSPYDTVLGRLETFTP